MPARTLILVRHAQYHLDAKHARVGSLTALGAQQGRRLARRLRHYPIDVVHSSTAPRAEQTSALIREQLPDAVPYRRSPLLVEGIPTAVPGVPAEALARIPEHRARMDRVFERYFQTVRRKDRMELIVCHGNILRYLLRRALGDAPDKWHAFAAMHCGISVVRIEHDRTTLVAFNDVGHLPPRMHTFT